MTGKLAVAWKLAKGYRLRPWQSPYLKWRIETWSGLEAASITPGVFLDFCWRHRADLRRYLRWAAANR
ncbi:MAG TPA: hypothetical protein VG273_10845 [Bryobacteraceae bacterium]|jgi:hypothetical protein|nr:hypothetical protein [Bryobacteraceae bacterium]